jgi:hypothetical protein
MKKILNRRAFIAFAVFGYIAYFIYHALSPCDSNGLFMIDCHFLHVIFSVFCIAGVIVLTIAISIFRNCLKYASKWKFVVIAVTSIFIIVSGLITLLGIVEIVYPILLAIYPPLEFIF